MWTCIWHLSLQQILTGRRDYKDKGLSLSTTFALSLIFQGKVQYLLCWNRATLSPRCLDTSGFSAGQVLNTSVEQSASTGKLSVQYCYLNEFIVKTTLFMNTYFFWSRPKQTQSTASVTNFNKSFLFLLAKTGRWGEEGNIFYLKSVSNSIRASSWPHWTHWAFCHWL